MKGLLVKFLNNFIPIACIVVFPTTVILLAVSETADIPKLLLKVCIITTITLIGFLMLFVAFIGIGELLRKD